MELDTPTKMYDLNLLLDEVGEEDTIYFTEKAYRCLILKRSKFQRPRQAHPKKTLNLAIFNVNKHK